MLKEYKYRVMVVYIAGLSMTIIDGTAVNVALPTLAAQFEVPTTDIEWVALAYLLALAAVIPAAGWLGDRFGSKRMFLVALSLFVAGSILSGLSQSLLQLVLFRVVQGFGAGLITPIGSAMLFRAFPLAERATATVGVLSVAVIAPAVGPILGGVLVDNASWRWIFLINFPIGVAGLVLARLWLREETQAAPGALDLGGLVLSIAGVSLLIFALSTGPDFGWVSVPTISAAAVGTVAIATLIWLELHLDQPMLALRLFGDRLFRTINIAGAMIYAGFFGWIFVMPLYLQDLRGFSATQSGLTQAPQAVAIFIVSNLLGKRVYKAVGPRRLLVFGSAITAAVTGGFAGFDLETPLWVVGSGSFARGLAMGMVFVSIQTAVYASISNADTGRAASVFNTQRQFSFASGVALAATVIATRVNAVGGESAPAAAQLGAYRWAFLAMGLVMLPAAFVSWFVADEDAAATRGLTPAATDRSRRRTTPSSV